MSKKSVFGRPVSSEWREENGDCCHQGLRLVRRHGVSNLYGLIVAPRTCN
jgi:hypothetical protein